MTQKDKELVAQASICRNYDNALAMEDEAQSQEAKDIIHKRCSHLWHMEEAMAGII